MGTAPDCAFAARVENFVNARKALAGDGRNLVVDIQMILVRPGSRLVLPLSNVGDVRL